MQSINELWERYAAFKAMDLSMNMSRGVPAPEQLTLSQEMLTNLATAGDCRTDGIDCRSYGLLTGIPAARRIFSEMLGVNSDNIIIGGNSSLNMMFDAISRAWCFGILGNAPWCRLPEVKFLCPVPGYDRHFAITEYFGIGMIPVPMNAEGPDMDLVEQLVKDEKVKGIWCVPKYSNPEGITFSDEVVRRMARLKPAAKDFRIFWDDAYAVHDLYEQGDRLLNLYGECVKAGNPDLPLIFTSTSKITFPGAGVAVEAASPNNVAMLKGRMKFQTIGPDKLNQLRHARMFQTPEDVRRHMKSHAAVLRPKFETVLNEMETRLGPTGIARWTKPRGGYFISLYVPQGCAKRVEQLCANAGLVLTPAGAAYPYGRDPQDANIRIAPSYPSKEEIQKAAVVLCVSVCYAALEKLLAHND